MLIKYHQGVFSNLLRHCNPSFLCIKAEQHKGNGRNWCLKSVLLLYSSQASPSQQWLYKAKWDVQSQVLRGQKAALINASLPFVILIALFFISLTALLTSHKRYEYNFSFWGEKSTLVLLYFEPQVPFCTDSSGIMCLFLSCP